MWQVADGKYACRAGTTGDYAGKIEDLSWSEENAGNQTHRVAAKKPNAWGFYDMHGNVAEWCLDYRFSEEVGNENNSSDRAVLEPNPDLGDSQLERIYKGGAWVFTFEMSRSGASYHQKNYDPYSLGDTGFRIALAPMADGK